MISNQSAMSYMSIDLMTNEFDGSSSNVEYNKELEAKKQVHTKYGLSLPNTATIPYGQQRQIVCVLFVKPTTHPYVVHLVPLRL